MNSWSRHFRFAVFVGVLTGFLVQFPVDIVTKIGLDLPALYQGLMMSGIFFFVVFILFAIFLIAIEKLLKINYGKYLELIYYTVSLSIIVVYYSTATFNFFFRKYLIFNINILANLSRFELFLPSLVILTAVILITLFALVKKKEMLFAIFEKSSVFKFLKKRVFKQIVFMLIFLICAALAVDAYLYFDNSEHNLNGIQESPAEGMPNVLLVVVDAMRADSMGFLGQSRNTTPFLDELADKSVVFENALTTSSRSMSSFASMFTGNNAGDTSVFLRHKLLEEDGKTLAELMGENGYNTAGFISMSVLDKRSGLDRGFAIYEDRHSFFEFRVYSEFDVLYALKKLPILGPNVFQYFGETTSDEVNDKAISWLNKNKDAPFFLFVHYFDPHPPYTPDKRTMHELSPEEIHDIDYSMEEIGVDSPRLAQTIRDNRLRYDSEIHQADHGIEQLITNIENLNVLDDTIVIVLSDHGQEFYEHNGFYHGNTLYEEALHVPFILQYTKRLAPQRIDERVSVLDLFSTILDLTGIEPPKGIDSHSLLPLIEGKSADNESTNRPIIAETIKATNAEGSKATNYLVTIYSGKWKLILAKENENQIGNALYDLRYDPLEKNNLYEEEEERREELKSLLFSHYKKSKAYLDSFPELGLSGT